MMDITATVGVNMSTIKIRNIELKNRICIAPLAGITDLPFRLILKEMGASLMTTELVSAKGIYYNNQGNSKIMATDIKEAPIALQLFGNDPLLIARVAEKVCDDYDIIDINMGCPVLKVVRNGEGAALMKDVHLAASIISMLKRVIGDKKVITAKMRIGFENHNINGVEFAKALEDAGVDMITLHGRTRNEFYGGEVHKDVIKKIKESVNIPVIANGNIFTIYDAKEMLDYTACDGIALARGIKGNPWFVRECIEYIENGKIIERPSLVEIKNMMLRHVKDEVDFKGEKVGIPEMRPHIAWYTVGLKDSSKFRLKVNSVKTKDEMDYIINEFFDMTDKSMD